MQNRRILTFAIFYGVEDHESFIHLLKWGAFFFDEVGDKVIVYNIPQKTAKYFRREHNIKSVYWSNASIEDFSNHYKEEINNDDLDKYIFESVRPEKTGHYQYTRRCGIKTILKRL